MAPDVLDPDLDSPPDDKELRTVRRWRVVGVAAILAMALFWLWIFSGAAKKENPDRVQDRAWVERAEATCAQTMARIERRSRTAGDEDQDVRADAIDESTDELHAMLDELRAPPPENAADREVVDPWLADWEKLLGDRETYADAVRENPDARFLTTEKFGDALDDVVATFATVNDMPSCGPAGDVG
jgi:hypothetical protein